MIFDVVRNSPSRRMVGSLRENGFYLTANPGLSQLSFGFWTSLRSSKRVIFGASSGKNEDLAYLRGLIEAGNLRPVVDRRYPLEQMAEAHGYAESGQKLGNIAISVGPRK